MRLPGRRAGVRAGLAGARVGGLNMSRSRLLVGSSVVALAAVLAGCGGTAAPTAAAPTSQPAATSAAPSPTPTPTPTGVGDLTAETFVATLAKAQTGLARTSARFEMVVTAQGQAINATGAMRAAADGSPEMTMTMTVPGTATIEMRLVGGIIYMNMGDVTGGKFVAMDPKDPSIGVPVPSDLDPASTAKDLQGAIVSVTKVGAPEQVGGALAQAYDVVVDLAKVTGATRQSLDSAATQAKAAGATLPPTVTYHYWIDADGLVRRVADEVLGASTQMTFEGWGQPVEIAAPTADQITNLDQQ